MEPNDSYSKAKKRVLAEINPVSPPGEIIKQIRSIVMEMGLEEDNVSKLLQAFFEHYKIDPNEPPLIAILRSGYQIGIEEPCEELLENLTNSIIHESIKAANKKGSKSWSYFFKILHNEIESEVDYVKDSVHDFTARLLFGYLLYKEVIEKNKNILEEAFPNLRGDPEKIAELLDDTKKGMVLLLGKDTGRSLRLLKRIKNHIESKGFSCVLIKEQPDNLTQGLISKVILYATMSRYVIIENTYPSGHLYELPPVRNAESIIVILQQEGKGASRMPDDMIPKHPLIRRFWYTSDTFEDTIDDGMEWVEKRIKENIEINRESWT